MDDYLAQRIALLEQHVNQLYARAGLPEPYGSAAGAGTASVGLDATLPPAVSEQVMMHIRAGNQIRAIKQLRDESGLELREARQTVDAVSASYRAGLIR